MSDKPQTPRAYGNAFRSAAEDPARCIEGVWHDLSRGHVQCSHKRGKGPGGLYCGKHDPAAVAARNEKSLARFREKLDNSPLALMRRRAEAAEAQVERLKGVLQRLGSAEAFDMARALDADNAELIMRMDFARSALEAKP